MIYDETLQPYITASNVKDPIDRTGLSSPHAMNQDLSLAHLHLTNPLWS